MSNPHRPARSQQPPPIRPELPGQMTAGQSHDGNGFALEDLDALTESERTSSRTTETADGTSWLLSCRWQEPAYSMYIHRAGEGELPPPSIPHCRAPESGSRESGRRRPRSILPVR